MHDFAKSFFFKRQNHLDERSSNWVNNDDFHFVFIVVEMQILIAKSIETFQNTPEERSLCERMSDVLTKHGHQVDVLSLPFVGNIQTLLEQAMGYRLLDLTASADRLIALDSPACLLRHPNKVIVVSTHYRKICNLRPINVSQAMWSSISQRFEHAICLSFAEASSVFLECEAIRTNELSLLPSSAVDSECIDFHVDDEKIADQLSNGKNRHSVPRIGDCSARRVA